MCKMMVKEYVCDSNYKPDRNKFVPDVETGYWISMVRRQDPHRNYAVYRIKHTVAFRVLLSGYNMYRV